MTKTSGRETVLPIYQEDKKQHVLIRDERESEQTLREKVLTVCMSSSAMGEAV